MLFENMVLKSDSGKIFRILKLKSDRAIVVPCDSYGLPRWMSTRQLSNWETAKMSSPEEFIWPDDDIPEWKRNERDRRWELIQNIALDTESVTDPGSRRTLIKQAAEKGRCHTRTICNYLWLYWVYQTPNALLPKDRKGKEKTAVPSEKESETKEYEKIFRWALNKFYYTSQHQTLEMSYRMMLREKFCDETGTLRSVYPSFWQFRYYFRQHRSRITEIISRQGLTEYQKNYRPFTGSVQVYAQNIGLFMTDSTQADIYVVSRLSRKVVGRPIVYTMVDAYSQLITGIYVGLESGKYALRMLLLNTCSDKKDYCKTFGIEIEDWQWPAKQLPRKIISDRGAEFTSGIMSNLCSAYNIEIDTLPAYRPDLKGPVEKLFDILQNAYKPFLRGKGVIEPNYQERGAPDYRRQGTIDIEQYTQILLRCVIHYNTQTILPSFVRTPDMVAKDIPAIPVHIWNYNLSENPHILQSEDAEKLKRVLLPRTDGRITQKGLIVFGGIPYNNPKYKERFVTAGIEGSEPVRVAYDPSCLDKVWVVERKEFVPFKLAAPQYQGQTFDEVIDLKQREKEGKMRAVTQNLQADIDLMNEIRDIVQAACPPPDVDDDKDTEGAVKQERAEEMQRLHREGLSASEKNPDSDILAMLQKFQKGEMD